MQENELDIILQELYRLDDSLRKFEGQLKPLLLQMSELKPDTKFTPALAAKIKAEVMQLIKAKPLLMPIDKSFKYNFMNKKIYLYAASVAVVGVVVIMVGLNLPGKSAGVKNLNNLAANLGLDKASKNISDEGVVRLASGAFGSLASAGQVVPSHGKMVADGREVSAVVAEEMSVSGYGGTANTGTMTLSAPASGDNVVSSRMASPGMAVDSKMIAPWYNVKYVYKGEALNLEEGQTDVYRRLKGGSASASALASSVSNLDLGGISIASFSNLSASSLSLQEEKDKGLSINFDFLEDTVNIYENWQRWRFMEREACTDDACWQKYRLSMGDVPADADLIAMADAFISDHQIDLKHYGQAEVDNTWRQNYNPEVNGNDFYVPEYAAVVYPLLVGNEPVRDTSGNLFGIRVTINLLQKAASGLNNLTLYRYEASAYPLENDSARLIKLAEAGGWNRNYYSSGENVQEVELGTPTKTFVQLWRYTDNRNDELLVPALIFPIKNIPEGFYYGQRSVIVPLVKELLGDLEQGQNGGGGIMPMAVDGVEAMVR